ncbi:MAG: hypothetical protein CEE38_22075 [Planctomycetes bacterium B3_Pla]|nr:MAG: hypothetical protein CEE38_22075 [Planctomycetes bacterium B3_Pla]
MGEAFKRHFERFLEDQTVVAGAPGVIFFTGEHAVLDGALAICQQVEQRVWVGLRCLGGDWRTQKEGISIPKGGRNHLVWLPGLKDQPPIPIECFRPPIGGIGWPKITQQLELFLNGLIKRPLCRSLLDLGGAAFELSILSELRSGSGCDFSGAFSVASIVAVHLASVWLGLAKDCITKHSHLEPTQGELHQLVEKYPRNMLTAPNKSLDLLNRAALAIECWFHGGRASGYGTICSIIPTRWPITYLRETPTSERPSRVPIDWDKLKSANSKGLTESEWKVVDSHILDPERGLQYAVGLFEWDRSLVRRVDAPLPFSFGTIYSGYPKDTAIQIKKVEELQAKVARHLAKDLDFFLAGALMKERFQLASVPTFLGMLEELQKTEHASGTRVPYGGIHWAGMLVASSLCALLRAASKKTADDRYVKLAMMDFAGAITAAQGGLSLLLLVDPAARRIEGRILDSHEEHEEWEGQIALKYTGGARGGNLVCIGPTQMDALRIDESLNEVAHRGEKRPAWDCPMVDYWSTDRPPSGKGIQFCWVQRPLVKSDLYHFKWGGKTGWVQKSRMKVAAWHVHGLLRENIEHRCVIQLDRDPKKVSWRIFLGSRDITSTIGRPDGRGKRLLPHLLFALLLGKGDISRKQAKKHVSKVGLNSDTYLGEDKDLARAYTDFERFIANPLRENEEWNQWFKLEPYPMGNSGDFNILLRPQKDKGEFFVYIQR